MVTERKPINGKKRVATPSGDRARSHDHLQHLIELGDRMPTSEVAKMPKDGARNFDHYLDGTPKQR